MKRIILLVMFILLSIYSLSLAASSTGSGLKADDGAILVVVREKCPQQWCKPEVVKVIDGYAVAILWCKKKNCENDAAFLKKVNNKWLLVEQGTGIEPDDLKTHGFTDRIANKLLDVYRKALSQK